MHSIGSTKGDDHAATDDARFAVWRPDGGSPARGPVAAPFDAPRVEEYLTFLLGEDRFAIAIERVREVLRSPPVTEVPRAPSHVLGVVTVRGEVLAVVDPRRRLSAAPSGPASDTGRLVVVDAGDGPLALRVDRVGNVVRLPAGALVPAPASAEACAAGVGTDRGRTFTVLDVLALLGRAPAQGEGRAHAAH